jgi:hypothetical protein
LLFGGSEHKREILSINDDVLASFLFCITRDTPPFLCFLECFISWEVNDNDYEGRLLWGEYGGYGMNGVYIRYSSNSETGLYIAWFELMVWF